MIHRLRCIVAAAVAVCLAGPVAALDRLDFWVAGTDAALTKALRAASRLVAARADGQVDAQDLFAAARADYGVLLGALYAAGHYSGVISIRIDGREAAGIAPLDAPGRIAAIAVTVEPGPPFRLAGVRVEPLAPGTELRDGFAPGKPALSAVVRAAAAAGVNGWRAQGHARAAVTGQVVTANHRDATLSAEIRLDPGPRLRFGPLQVEGAAQVRAARIVEIAGLPEGAVFAPAEMDRAAERLRRSGVFRSVTLTEGAVAAPDLLGVTATVVEQMPRRIGLGAEVANSEGLSLTGYWLHRNLLGGAERLRIDTELAQIGALASGMDYRLGLSLERPATLGPDTTLGMVAEIGRLDEVDYRADVATLGLRATQHFSPALTGRAGLDYEYSEGRDKTGTFLFRNMAVPLGVTWDRRDAAMDATRGWYVDAEVKPFFGFATTGSGVRSTADARAYLGFGTQAGFVLAGRVQAGIIAGSGLLDTPRDDLFHSGGGGTVRGQPYQSLGLSILRGAEVTQIGGTHHLGAQFEARARVSGRIGIVGFYDAGRIDGDGFFRPGGDWHAGAGLGLRYDTGFGPVRLDVAVPVGGTTGTGLQIYVGLGQAF